MTRVLVLLAVAGLLGAQPAPEFDAVSIKPYAPKAPPYEGCNSHGDPGRLMLVGCPLRTLILQAYGLKGYQLAQGPQWTEDDRYVVEAHATAPANRSEMMRMLQGVLADRFQLRVHWVEQPAPVYLLETAGHGLKAGTATRTDHCGEIDFRPPKVHADCLTMDDFADFLQQSIVKDHPVINRTGADKGNRYQFNLEFVADDDPAGPSIFAALPDQLGLTLKTGKEPVRTLTIDHVERPRENQ